ncbi:TonB-dependent receptor [Marivirga sp. S37H4]|uniref:TonB-dependent receptor n=1 Tax=Marivirga aurantiaca TaxID=2802615 RepID=A0A935C8I2_9BACT|nr:TonB-dependent receptor [Marivirga aurantiaca]
MQLLIMSLIAFMATDLSAQVLTQTIRGKIIDTDSKSPIAFANIIVTGSQPLLGATSDTDGYFTIEAVPVGRATIKVSYIGYEDKLIPNLVVISGKETVLDIELKESFETLNEVTVSARQHKSEINNEMAQVSSRSLSVEESKRYAGGIGDPARLVSSFAGVGSTGEGNNDIIVRGNNPRYIQWKLEGTEIPNPNHFSQEGLTGGPINALNSQMLANSEFYTGAFAPEFGNALSGIFDMRLRKGNSEKREHSFSIGVLGTDLTTEGPFKKGGKSSYLINYRYSTLAIISSLGFLDFGGVPKYQDLSFKVFIPTEKAGTFSFFGLGGLNNIKSEFYDPENEEEVNEEFQQKGQLGVAGVSHIINLNKKAYISSTLSYSNNGSEYSSSRIFDSSVLQEDQKANTSNNIVRLNTSLNYKLNNRHQFQLGSVSSQFNFDFKTRYFDSAADQFIQGQDITGTASLYQSFITWKWRASEKLSLVNGIHSQNTSENDEITFEPRSSLRYELPKGQAITAGIGVHSNMTSLSNYNTIVYDEEGNKSTPNSSLELLKARHYVLGYENRLSKNLFLKVEGYYQDLYDIPVEEGNSSYSLINQTYEFSDRVLVNEGKGRNIGLELTLERYFANNYYFLVTGSLFDSKYKASDDVWRNTLFNGNYIANGLFGKEFMVGKSKNNVIGINSKLSLLGARRVMTIDLEKSIESGSVVHDEANAFQKKGEDVFSLNLAISYRINKPRLSHEFKIDVQNVTNNTAVIDYYYYDVNKSIEKVEQLPMLPVLSYTLNF